MRYIFLLILFLLAGCGTVTQLEASSSVIEINNSAGSNSTLDSIISPYKSELEEEMNEVLATASQDFVKGRPNGALNNWSTDVLLQTASIDTLRPTMALLNVGGLRNPISKGDVKLEDIFKLMPFDNEVVIVTMPISSLEDIAEYLVDRGGEPIAGAKLEQGALSLMKGNGTIGEFRIITSDYLFKGGDYMNFFQAHISVEYTGELLRDVFIRGAKDQGELIWNNEERIVFE